MILLTKDNLKNYLVEKCLLQKKEKAEMILLQGGNVNTIFRIKTKTREFVIKQILEEPQNKKIFHETVKFDKQRILLEVKTIEILHKILPLPHVPKLLFYDAENYVIAMSAVSSSAQLYQTELFEGRFYFDQAYELGKWTAAMHSATYLNKEIEALFQEKIGLGLRAYTITSSFDKLPHLKKQLTAAFQKAFKNKFCLVDADVTHKNILVHAGTFTKLDFETVHYGDPALDVGILLAHYLLPAFVYPQWKEEYFAAAQLYWQAYQKYVTFPIPQQFFINMKNYMAMMMLGRIDSAVVLPWLEGKHDEIRNAAVRIFTDDSRDFSQICEKVKDFL